MTTWSSCLHVAPRQVQTTQTYERILCLSWGFEELSFL